MSTEKHFEVIDESDARRDLAARRETKYVIEDIDVATLRTVLEGNATRLVHNHAVSTVRSVYFDDCRLSACHANLSGLGNRRKLRLRWYDSPLPKQESYLEIKWRSNRVTGKHRLKLRSSSALSTLTYGQWHQQLMQAAPTRFVADLLRYSDPIVVVEYKREHFASMDGRIRTTIDYDLRFYDQTGKQSVSMDFPHAKHNFIVLEGKTPVGCEYELRSMLYPLQLRPQRCSKYVYGCQMLGLVRY